VTITAEKRRDITIEAGLPSDPDIDIDERGFVVLTSARGGSARLEVRCPTGTDLVVGTASGKVELHGDFGEVRVTTASGKIEVDSAQTLDLRSVSGSIEVARCAGRCRLQTKSGRATVGSAEDTDVSTVSGQVQLASGRGNTHVRTASGRVELGTRGKGDVDVETLSGSVRVEVPASIRPAVELRSTTGKARCGCHEGQDCCIAVSSMTGKIEVVPS
jgi:DUF4097 and DUF4098 domain-containing protein YvlB